MRVIGNGFKLLNIIGGKVMRKVRNIIQNQLASGVEILLVVGNTGGIFYKVPLLSDEDGRVPRQKSHIPYMPSSSNRGGIFVFVKVTIYE